MDVAQALQEAQEATTEAEVTAQSPISHPAPGQVKPELPALPIEKRKSGFDMYSDHVMPSLAEEGLSTRQSIQPELDMQEVEVDPDVRGEEQTYLDGFLPVQQDTRFIEIRE